MFNFAFDCRTAPIGGSVAIDQARIGAGALSVSVATQVPSGGAEVVTMGPGCGTPTPALAANGSPIIPNAGFELHVTSSPGAFLLMFFSTGPANLQIAPGCFQYLDPLSVIGYGVHVTDGAGLGVVPVPVPNDPGFDGVPIYWQAAQDVPGGPILGAFTISNGLITRFGCR